MKHSELINSIIEAERQAQTMAAEAREKKLRLRDELKENAAALREKYIAQADNRIKTVREKEDARTDDAVHGVIELHRMEMADMERLYSEHRGEWVETLYALVAGRK